MSSFMLAVKPTVAHFLSLLSLSSVLPHIHNSFFHLYISFNSIPSHHDVGFGFI